MNYQVRVFYCFFGGNSNASLMLEMSFMRAIIKKEAVITASFELIPLSISLTLPILRSGDVDLVSLLQNKFHLSVHFPI